MRKSADSTRSSWANTQSQSGRTERKKWLCIVLFAAAIGSFSACKKQDSQFEVGSIADSPQDREDYPGFHEFLKYSQPDPPKWRDFSKSSRPVIRLVGFDGVGWSELNIMLKKYDLPNLRRLLEGGSVAVLRTDTASSPIAWTTIACGKDRMHHGILGEDETGQSPFTYTEKAVKVPRVWDMFRYHNIPVRLGRYYFITDGDYRNENMLEHCDTVLKDSAGSDYGFFMTYVDATDYWQHQGLLAFHLKETTWGQNFIVDPRWAHWVDLTAKAIVDIFRQMDKLIERLIYQYPNDYLIIVSDHGMRVDQPALKMKINTDSDYFLPGWIKKELPTCSNQPSSKTIQCWRIEPGFQLKLMEETRSLDIARNRTTGLEISLPVTTTRIEIIPPDDDLYQDERTRVRDELLALNFLDAKVFYLDQDGSLRITEAMIHTYTNALITEKIKVFNPVWQMIDHVAEFGTHKPEDQGIFLAYGPTIRKGIVAPQLDLVDVTPTLLYLGGLPVGKDMQGKVAEAIVSPDYLKNHPITYTDSYDPLIKLEPIAGSRGKLAPERQKAYRESGYPGLD